MREPSNIQKQAINHLSGPAEVIAGPGSGKTFTIIQRILYLVNHHGISPHNILVITYTKAAALEMQERYQIENKSHTVHFGTFHSICYQILMQSGHSTNQSLISENQKRKILKIVLENQNLSEKTGYDFISEILNNFSKQKNGMFLMNSEDSISTINFTYNEIIAIKKEYESIANQNDWIDFDDIIHNCYKLLNTNHSICKKYQNLFQYILVDEFQDINAPQYEILKLLAGEKQNLFVVGDDDQAIYGFRGATPGIMQQFYIDFPNTKQIFLTENYRSGEKIVHAADQVIKENKVRFEKEFIPIRKGGKIEILDFNTRKEETEEILNDIKKDKIVLPDETAIILRTNLEAMQYYELLKENGIPVREGKKTRENAFDSFITEDIKSFLNFTFNGNKRSDFLYFMNKPNHYFNRMALPFDIVKKEHMLQYYHNNLEMIRTVEKLFRNIKTASKLSPNMAISLFRKAMGYEQYLKEKAENVKQEKLWIHQLNQIQEITEKSSSVKDVVHYIDMMQREEAEKKPKTVYCKGVHIINMHGAKGLEFKKVYLPDINEGIIPGKRCITKEELEEERRLLYVAITRAKDSLFISYTRERNRKMSRYLESITLPRRQLAHQILHCQAIHQTHPIQSRIPHHLQLNQDEALH